MLTINTIFIKSATYSSNIFSIQYIEGETMLRFDEDLAKKCEHVLVQLSVIEEMYQKLLANSLGANRNKVNFEFLKSTIEYLKDEELESFIQQQRNQYADNPGIQAVIFEYYEFLKFKQSIERSFSTYSFENVTSSYMLPKFDIENYPTLNIYSIDTAPADLRNQAMPVKSALEGVIEEVKAIHLQTSFSVNDRSGLLFRSKVGDVSVSRNGVVQPNTVPFLVSSNKENDAADRIAKQKAFDLRRKQAKRRKKSARSFFNSKDDSLQSKHFKALLAVKFEDEFVKRYIENEEIGPIHVNYVSPENLYNNLLDQYVAVNKLIIACNEYGEHLKSADPVKFAAAIKVNHNAKVDTSNVTFENKVMVYRDIDNALKCNSAGQALDNVKAVLGRPETKQILTANRDGFGTRLLKSILFALSWGKTAKRPGLWKSHGAIHAEKLESIVSPAKGHSRG